MITPKDLRLQAICLWEWSPDEVACAEPRTSKVHWRLERSMLFPEADDRAINNALATWFTTRAVDDDGDFFGTEDILGRAATTWDFARGTRLHKFNPISWPRALGVEARFVDKLSDAPDWDVYLVDGTYLYFETQRQAEKLVVAHLNGLAEGGVR